MMLVFNAFNPYALLAGKVVPHVKPANPAKVSTSPPVTLASLATLAEQYAQSCPMPASDNAAWNTADWQESYDERVGHITEGDDGKLLHAEQQAFREYISRWLARHPDPHADPDTCPQCGASSGVTAALPSTPFLNPGGWVLAIHDVCIPAWCERRRQEAVAALAEMGLKGQAI